MRKVFLLTGFSNWGKSTLIKQVFSRGVFYRKSLYEIPSINGVEFCVQPQSNDDWGFSGYKKDLENRIDEVTKIYKPPTHIFSAFCPTREMNNLSEGLINSLFSGDQVFVIPIETKWCGHAKLDVKEIANYFSNCRDVSIHTLSGNSQSKPDDLVNIIKPLV